MEGSPDSLTVGERLYANAIERNLRKEKAEIDAKIKEESDCSFKPAVNKMLSPHAADDTFERLYQNAEEQRIARDVRESVGNNECTFQPEINERSRELARHSDDRSLHEYLYKEGLAKTLQRQSLGDYKTTLRHRMEDEEMEHCTFDPVIWKGKKRNRVKTMLSTTTNLLHPHLRMYHQRMHLLKVILKGTMIYY